MFFKKKRVTFDKAAKFNYELDTNEALKGTLLKLSLSHNKMKSGQMQISHHMKTPLIFSE